MSPAARRRPRGEGASSRASRPTACATGFRRTSHGTSTSGERFMAHVTWADGLTEDTVRTFLQPLTPTPRDAKAAMEVTTTPGFSSTLSDMSSSVTNRVGCTDGAISPPSPAAIPWVARPMSASAAARPPGLHEHTMPRSIRSAASRVDVVMPRTVPHAPPSAVVARPHQTLAPAYGWIADTSGPIA